MKTGSRAEDSIDDLKRQLPQTLPDYSVSLLILVLPKMPVSLVFLGCGEAPTLRF